MFILDAKQKYSHKMKNENLEANKIVQFPP